MLANSFIARIEAVCRVLCLKLDSPPDFVSRRGLHGESPLLIGGLYKEWFYEMTCLSETLFISVLTLKHLGNDK